MRRNVKVQLEDIRKIWTYEERDVAASIEMWDSMATKFGEFELPSSSNSTLLKLLEENEMLQPEYTVLDVGCGAGKYSLALAKKCQNVVGLDLSSKMIEKAKIKKEEMGIENAEFHVCNWHELDLKQIDYMGKFDLVIANMTPGVRSAETFEKLHQASRGYCVLAKPIKRTDPVSDEIRKMLSIERKMETGDKDILYAFALLWLQGILPKLIYEPRIWDQKRTVDEASKLYVNRMKSYRELTSDEEDQIDKYLMSIAKDGHIEEKVNTTIATMYWEV